MKHLNLKQQLLFVLVFIYGFYAMAGNKEAPFTQPKKPKQANLKQVFTTQVMAGNKDVLKLYDDNTYEFLFFQIKNKKPVVKRERGTYSWKKNKLNLSMKGKHMIKEHATRFVYIDEKGLYKPRLLRTQKVTAPEYAVTTENKFWEPVYFDSIYGHITNDKKALKKIIEVKKEKPAKPASVYEVINEYGEVGAAELNNTGSFVLPH